MQKYIKIIITKSFYLSRKIKMGCFTESLTNLTDITQKTLHLNKQCIKKNLENITKLFVMLYNPLTKPLQ